MWRRLPHGLAMRRVEISNIDVEVEAVEMIPRPLAESMRCWQSGKKAR